MDQRIDEIQWLYVDMIMVEAGCWIHGSSYYGLLLYITKIAV